MKLYILLLWSIQFLAIAVALIAIFAFIGGWFIWGWGLFENICMTVFDVVLLAFSTIVTYIIWRLE